MMVYPQMPCAYVVRNNDIGVWGEPYDRFFEFGGKKIFLTHGHKYGVKMSPARVVAEAKKKGADICIFGHTHKQYFDSEDIIVINPGGAYKGYGILTIDGDEASVEFREV